MRLCANHSAQPAHISVTRRRSAPPRPPSRIPVEGATSDTASTNRQPAQGLTRGVPYQLQSRFRSGFLSFISLLHGLAFDPPCLPKYGQQHRVTGNPGMPRRRTGVDPSRHAEGCPATCARFDKRADTGDMLQSSNTLCLCQLHHLVRRLPLSPTRPRQASGF